MLIGFTFKNFMSFYGETVLSLRATKNERFQELNTFNANNVELLKSAFIFGANASGKTNLIKAIKGMISILHSDTITQSNLIKNLSKLTSFIYMENAKKIPSSFEIEFIQDNVSYRYFFEVQNEEIVKEYLFKKTKRETPIFERENNNFTFTGKDMDDVKDLTSKTRQDNLFLFKAYDNNNQIAKNIYKWFEKIKYYSTDDAIGLLSGTINYLVDNEHGTEKVLAFLQQADNNILEFDYEIKGNVIDLNTNRYKFNDKKEISKIVRTPKILESSGTIKTFELAGAIIQALESGSIIFIDEFDSKLHPLLVRHIAELFNSIHNNPHNAQLICNTHDVLLLEEDLRKDQIYLTEKDEYGMSNLFSICEFKGLRKDSNLLKLYLLGSFGAVPRLKEILIQKKNKGVAVNE